MLDRPPIGLNGVDCPMSGWGESSQEGARLCGLGAAVHDRLETHRTSTISAAAPETGF